MLYVLVIEQAIAIVLLIYILLEMYSERKNKMEIKTQECEEIKPKRKEANYFITILNKSGIDSVMVCETKIEVAKRVVEILETPDKEGEYSYSIASIIKGHEIKFKTKASIEFL